MKKMLILSLFIPFSVSAGSQTDDLFMDRIMSGVVLNGLCESAWQSLVPYKLKLTTEERTKVLMCAWYESERSQSPEKVTKLEEWLLRHPEYSAQHSDAEILSAWHDQRLKHAETGDNT